MKIYLLAFLFLSVQLFGDPIHTVDAKRIDSEIKVDGSLSDPIWQTASTISNFTSWRPVPGLTPAHQTEVKILYDDEALYVGATMKVSSRDSIMTELSQRDNLGNTDFVGIFLDTYGNGTDAFEFIVGATGVQFDAKLSTNDEDRNWDAVWFSAVELSDTYWSAEFKIPYSAIRFSGEKVQNWKVNFIRNEAVIGQRSSWHPIDPQAPVFLAQMGAVTGIQDIKAPPRLSISPYFSTYLQSYKDGQNGISSSGFSYNGGMDLKYGINDAFTLDMTLIPDFGQVQSDNLVLNLSPFEVRYAENRQFFTEGTELFNKGGYFYSRRIGGSPIGQYDVDGQLQSGEEIISNPGTSQLINASKVSGRTGSGLGIGVFNAIAKETNAVVRDTETGEERMIRTAPLTNYNVLVFDQNLKNNSSVSLINTNVWRTGEGYYNANVTAGELDLKIAEQKFQIEGGVAVSQKYFEDAENDFGLKFNINLEKIRGNFNYGVFYDHVGEDFDPNDMGFQTFGNNHTVGGYANYNINEPFGKFNNASFWFNYEYSRLLNPNRFSEMNFNTGLFMMTKSFLRLNLWMNFAPKAYDFFEPRVWGREYVEPSWGNVGIWFGTDNRKKFRTSSHFVVRNTNEEGRNGWSYSVRPRYRFNDKFNVRLSHQYNKSNNTPRYVDNVDDHIIFGKRMQSTIENLVSLNYSFTEKMGMDFRLRHYWSKVQYNGFNELSEDGGLAPTDYDEHRDFTYNLLNIDLNFRWRFSAGSDIIINWKNSIFGELSDERLDFSEEGYFDGISGLNKLPQDNRVSLRIVYYLDYQRMSELF